MASEARTNALERLKKARQVDKVIWPAPADAPTYLYGRLSTSAEKEPEDLVHEFLAKHGDLYGIASRN